MQENKDELFTIHIIPRFAGDLDAVNDNYCKNLGLEEI